MNNRLLTDKGYLLTIWWFINWQQTSNCLETLTCTLGNLIESVIALQTHQSAMSHTQSMFFSNNSCKMEKSPSKMLTEIESDSVQSLFLTFVKKLMLEQCLL